MASAFSQPRGSHTGVASPSHHRATESCEAVASVVGPIVDLKGDSEENLLVHAWYPII